MSASHNDIQSAKYHAMLIGEIQALKTHINPQVPNPAPLGLFAFGLTTALLQLAHTNLSGSQAEDDAGTVQVVIGFAMFFGGLLQIIAGLGEVARNNIFGYTAFLLYGGFWMSVGTMNIVQLIATEPDKVGTNPKAVQGMMYLCGIFTTILWLGTFRMNKVICSVFFFLAITFFLLGTGVHNETVDKVGGWFGMLTAADAYFLGGAELLNNVYGPDENGDHMIPLGAFTKPARPAAAKTTGKMDTFDPSLDEDNTDEVQA